MAQVILDMKGNRIEIKGKSPLKPHTFAKLHSMVKKILNINKENIPGEWITMLEYIQAPQLLPNRYIPLYVIPMDNLLSYVNHHRLRVFLAKGRKCVKCGLQGRYLINTVDMGGNQHIDLYSSEFTLMTIDHIKPKSKGGLDELSNLQPMCYPCNQAKGNTWTFDTGGNPVEISY